MKKIILLVALMFSIKSLALLPSQVDENFSAQISIAKNTYLPMSARWKSLLKAGELASGDQIDEIRAFAKSSDWYMRNAAMTALDQISADYGIEEAKNLIHDQALVVRSAAIDLLAKKHTIENRKILAGELSKPYNFNGKKSLWIRPQIIRHLSAQATIDDRTFFARQLFDRDPEVVQLSEQTLAKITNINFSGSDPLSQWKTYVKKNGWN